jgi:nucleoside-diphosphate-sugar epimerase
MPSTTPSVRSQPGKVLVLGANGRFGAAAVLAFAAAGWHVVAQARRTLAGRVPASVQPLTAPLDQPGDILAAARGATHVVHALNPAYTDWAQQLLPMASTGMDIAQALGATFMVPGNVYNHGASMPPCLTPETPEHPTTAKGKLRCQLEAMIAARGQHGLHSVIIRAGDFYGAGRGSWMDLVILKSLAKGKLVYPGPWDVPHAWAYLPDVAQTFVAVAARQDVQPPNTRLHLKGHTLTGAQLLDALQHAADTLQPASASRSLKALKRSRMPWWPLRLAAPFAPALREVAEMAYLSHVPHALSDDALQRAIGSPPCTPLHDAMTATIHHQLTL